jgi:hypothetical protein
VADEAGGDLKERKARQRRQAYDARNAQPDKDEVSRVIVDRFTSTRPRAR